MEIKIKDLFHYNKETGTKKYPNLTEEQIYKYTHYFINIEYGKIPVFSGATLNNGVVGYVPDLRTDVQKDSHVEGTKKGNKEINYYKNKKEGCITIVADGSAGHSFFRPYEKYKIFCMNISCIALFKKNDEVIKKTNKEYTGLDIEWFSYKFYNKLKNEVAGAGVQHFTKTIFNDMDPLDIPEIEKQLTELGMLRKIFTTKKYLENNIERLEKLIEEI
jgi:hypothetical protein